MAVTPGQPPDHTGPVLFLVAIAMAAFIAAAGGLGRVPEDQAPEPGQPTVSPSDGPTERERRSHASRGKDKPSSSPSADAAVSHAAAELPGGGTRIFGNDRFLVAYYGTARHRRARRAGRDLAGRDAPAGDARGASLSSPGGAAPAGLRADRHHRRPRPRPRRRLQPRHLPRGGPAVRRRRPPARRDPAARPPARPVDLPRGGASGGPGRWSTPGSGSPSTPSGGSARSRCRPA